MTMRGGIPMEDVLGKVNFGKNADAWRQKWTVLEKQGHVEVSKNRDHYTWKIKMCFDKNDKDTDIAKRVDDIDEAIRETFGEFNHE